MVWLYGAKSTQETSKETARRLLALAVLEAWGWECLPPMERAEGGKPYFSHCPGYHFNLSHSGPYALCALSDGGEVGVDVERMRPHRPSLPRYVMSEEEFASFGGSWEEFTAIWTLKEAHAKYLGRSIWPPKEVSATPPVPHKVYAGEDWRAALCAEEEDLPDDILWRQVPVLT